MKCPNCGLTNPPEAMVCDCGCNLEREYTGPSDRQPTIRGLSCPKCETIAKGKHGCLIWAFVILLFPIGLLLLLTKKTYSCSGCGYTFKA